MKKIFVSLFLLLSVGVFSQEIKIAYVNSGEVFNLMPELAEASSQFEAIAAQFQEQYQSMMDELNQKAEEYRKLEATLNENLKLRRQQELEGMQERIQNFIPESQQLLEQERAKLTNPIQEKLLNAIKQVGEEQGYTYIIDSQAMLHIGKSAIDATQLVKTKLNIK